MPAEPKIVLELPLSDETLLSAFVEQCIADNVSLIAVVGEGCERMEDKIDWMIVTDDSRFITTSSHPGETLKEATEFASMWWVNADGPTSVVRIWTGS